MTLTIAVPVNTMLADLDETLRALLRSELADHGFDGVDIGFEAPTSGWAASLSAPTVNVFLHDVREAEEERRATWVERRHNGRAWRERPPLVLDCSFSVTAWTREVEDEHRLLSQVAAVLAAYCELPADRLAGRLIDTDAYPLPVRARVGESRSAVKAEFWSIMGHFKASIPYVVTLGCASGVVLHRGPEVATHSVRTQLVDGAPGGAESRHRAGGVVRDAAGQPVEGAWVVLPVAGRWASSGPGGRFTVGPVAPGRHAVQARSAAGGSAQGELVVPGPSVELVLDEH